MTDSKLDAMRPNPYADLPRVVLINEVSDAGEYGAATCPHCGAQGRYIYWFTCADGSTRGAMAGCFAHFPKHRFVTIHQRILAKQRDFLRRGWGLPTWDADTLTAIEAYGGGQMGEAEADAIIRQANAAKAAYMRRRGYRR